jgi:hypothetical protein
MAVDKIVHIKRIIINGSTNLNIWSTGVFIGQGMEAQCQELRLPLAEQ